MIFEREIKITGEILRGDGGGQNFTESKIAVSPAFIVGSGNGNKIRRVVDFFRKFPLEMRFYCPIVI